MEWVAEGLTSDEINLRASTFEDPFDVSRQQVDYYRNKYKIDITELREKAEFEALNVGLAKTSKRVELLKRLADKMVKELFDDDLFWTDDRKGVGSGDIAEIIDYEKFNSAEITQLRGVLEDIAKEVGGRVQRVDQKTEISGKVVVVSWDEDVSDDNSSDQS